MIDLGSHDFDRPGWEKSLIDGDIVTLGPSRALVFEVMAVRGDKAWLRGLEDGLEGVIDLAGFRTLGRGAHGAMQ